MFVFLWQILYIIIKAAINIRIVHMTRKAMRIGVKYSEEVQGTMGGMAVGTGVGVYDGVGSGVEVDSLSCIGLGVGEIKFLL